MTIKKIIYLSLGLCVLTTNLHAADCASLLGGTSMADTFSSTAKRDCYNAKDGDDVLNSAISNPTGISNDQLMGGNGSDTYNLTYGLKSSAESLDFNIGEDKIVVTGKKSTQPEYKLGKGGVSLTRGTNYILTDANNSKKVFFSFYNKISNLTIHNINITYN